MLEHEVGGTSQSCGEDAECFTFAVALAQALDVSLAARVAMQEADSGFGEGPLEMGAADLGAARAEALAIGAVLGLDEAAVGAEVLHAREARDGVDLVEDGEPEDGPY